MIDVFYKASEHLGESEKFSSIEELQKGGITVAYFFTIETNKEKKETGILIDQKLNVIRPAIIEDLEKMRYSPPRTKEIIHKEDRRFNMPTISEEEYLKKKLEPGGAGNT